MHDARHSADLREVSELRRPAAVANSEVSERFHGNVDSDLVAVLEAVGQRLGRGIYAAGNLVDAMVFDAVLQCLAGEAHDPQRRIVSLNPHPFIPQGYHSKYGPLMVEKGLLAP